MEISRLRFLFSHDATDISLPVFDEAGEHEEAVRLTHLDLFLPDLIRKWVSIMQDGDSETRVARLLYACELEISEGVPFPVEAVDLITQETLAIKIYESAMKYRGFTPEEVELIKRAETYARSAGWWQPPFYAETIDKANKLIERKRQEHDRTGKTY